MQDKTKSVGVVAISEGKVLLVKHAEKAEHVTGIYGLPGGRPNDGESEIEAAHREFCEETGLSADARDFAEFSGNEFEASIMRKNGKNVTFLWRVFKVTKFRGEPVANEETIPEWISIDLLQSFEDEGRLLPNTINAIRAANV